MKTDPNHESPDIIDQRDPRDPSHWDARPGDPLVLPGITLPTTLPAGWTLDADGALVPPPVPEPLTIPEITITPAPAPSSSSSAGALMLLGLFAAGWAVVHFAEGLLTDAIPAGFAPIFAGWNVWSVWQKNDLDTELGSIGLDDERRLRVWVEDTADAASGAQLHDPLNPSAKHFDGDEVDVLQNAAGLSVAVNRSSVPVGITPIDGAVTLRYVRFYNRGQPTVLAWPHSSNYMLESVYQPSTANAATNAPAPTAATEVIKQAAHDAAAAVSSGLTVLTVIGGGILALLLLQKLGKGR